MPDGVRVEIEGIKDLARTLRKAGDEGARDLLIGANREAAKTVERAASPLVARRTGRLAATLRSAGNAKGGVVLLGKAKVPYAGPIEFGWFKRNIKPRTALFRAMDVSHSKVEEIYLQRLDELLETVQGA